MARNITFIPAQNQNEVRMKAQNIKKLRMAAYCRVSTDQEDQLHSFDAQVNYYKKYIEYKMIRVKKCLYGCLCCYYFGHILLVLLKFDFYLKDILLELS